MQELTFDQVEEVNGGAVVNPVTAGAALGAVTGAASAAANGASLGGIAMAGAFGALSGASAGIASMASGFVKVTWYFRSVAASVASGQAK